MPLYRTRTFRSGNSEAIRLPKDMAFGDDAEVVIVRSGDVVTIYRAATTVAEMVERLRSLPAVAEVGLRDGEEPTEREGL